MIIYIYIYKIQCDCWFSHASQRYESHRGNPHNIVKEQNIRKGRQNIEQCTVPTTGVSFGIPTRGANLDTNIRRVCSLATGGVLTKKDKPPSIL